MEPWGHRLTAALVRRLSSRVIILLERVYRATSLLPAHMPRPAWHGTRGLSAMLRSCEHRKAVRVGWRLRHQHMAAPASTPLLTDSSNDPRGQRAGARPFPDSLWIIAPSGNAQVCQMLNTFRRNTLGTILGRNEGQRSRGRCPGTPVVRIIVLAEVFLSMCRMCRDSTDQKGRQLGWGGTPGA